MNFKRIVSRLLVAGFAALSVSVSGQTLISDVKPLFEYPQVPDALTRVNLRSNYMILHLWDDCPLDKEPITNIESFRSTFNDYISFFVLADMEEIHQSVKDFVDKVSKNKTNLQTVLGFMETELYDLHAPYCSDDIYIIFSKYLVDNKRVDKDTKERLEIRAKMLANSRLETVMGDFPIVDAAGRSATLYSLPADYTFVFFNSDHCIDCSIYKLRLSTDIVTNKLVKSGHVSFVSVFPEELPGIDTVMKDEPAGWCTAKMKDMEDTYDMRIVPCIYLLDKDKKILEKSPNVDSILTFMARLSGSLGL